MVLYDSFQYYKQYNLIKRKRRITNKKKTFKLEISDLMVAIPMQGCSNLNWQYHIGTPVR